MKKILSYIFLFLGILGVIFSFSNVRNFLKITLPPQIKESYILIMGGIFLLLGALFSVGKGGKKKKSEELMHLPVYKGNEIVAYRIADK